MDMMIQAYMQHNEMLKKQEVAELERQNKLVHGEKSHSNSVSQHDFVPRGGERVDPKKSTEMQKSQYSNKAKTNNKLDSIGVNGHLLTRVIFAKDL